MNTSQEKLRGEHERHFWIRPYTAMNYFCLLYVCRYRNVESLYDFFQSQKESERTIFPYHVEIFLENSSFSGRGLMILNNYANVFFSVPHKWTKQITISTNIIT